MNTRIRIKTTALLILFILSGSINAQSRKWPDTPEERINLIKEIFGGVPPILLNDKEVSIEEISQVDPKTITTNSIIPAASAVELTGGKGKGKDGFLYIRTDNGHSPSRGYNDYYYFDNDDQRKLIGLVDSMINHADRVKKVPDFANELGAFWTLKLYCYVDEYGYIDSAVVKEIALMHPYNIKTTYWDGKDNKKQFFSRKFRRMIRQVEESTVEAIESFPKLEPPVVYFNTVKSKFRIIFYYFPEVENY